MTVKIIEKQSAKAKHCKILQVPAMDYSVKNYQNKPKPTKTKTHTFQVFKNSFKNLWENLLIYSFILWFFASTVTAIFGNIGKLNLYTVCYKICLQLIEILP